MRNTHSLKNGTSILIRQATPTDASALIQLKHSYLRNTKTIPLYIDEYTNTEKEESEWISNFIQQPNSCLLVAEHQGQLVSNIDLTGNQRKKLFHTGVIGMGVHIDWQGFGIGSLLMHTLIDWARTNKHLQLLWLEVYASNLHGLALYKKFGFLECGRIPNFFREDDLFIDKITMNHTLTKF